MARLLDELFDKDTVISKAIRGFIFGGLEPLAGFLIIPRNPHALAAAARRRLNHDRIADFI